MRDIFRNIAATFGIVLIPVIIMMLPWPKPTVVEAAPAKPYYQIEFQSGTFNIKEWKVKAENVEACQAISCDFLDEKGNPVWLRGGAVLIKLVK